MTIVQPLHPTGMTIVQPLHPAGMTIVQPLHPAGIKFQNIKYRVGTTSNELVSHDQPLFGTGTLSLAVLTSCMRYCLHRRLILDTHIESCRLLNSYYVTADVKAEKALGVA